MKILSFIQDMLNPIVPVKDNHAHYTVDGINRPPKIGCLAVCGHIWKNNKTEKDNGLNNGLRNCASCVDSMNTGIGYNCTNCNTNG